MDENNASLKKFLEKTSADPTQAGFDFQFYAFLYLILNMEKDSSLEYDTDDDISYIKPNGVKILIQAKNAIQRSNGKWPKLTVRDYNIWHTIDNWITQFQLSEDKDFFRNRNFRILTNKSFEENDLYSKIVQFKDYKIEANVIEETLDNLIAKTSKVSILNAMNKLKSINEVDKKLFYKHFEIKQFEGFTIIQEIKDLLKYGKSISQNKIELVYSSLLEEFMSSHFINSCQRKKTKLTAEDMYLKTKRCFNRSFDRTLTIDRSVCDQLPDSIDEEIFVKQLIDIEYINKSNKDFIREIYVTRLGAFNTLSKYRLDGDIDSVDFETIKRNALYYWKTEFGISNRDIMIKRDIQNSPITENEYKSAGLNCFNSIARHKIELDSIHLDQEMTLGYFYDLSDKPEIGWRYDWEYKYKSK